ncbi:hypothetical protein E5720_15640 [Rhodococcus sp. PAMC28707]|uniref:hypothetical protein n=1 Tax=unclassified Rhodococcus (in: high G+C Gram-positive bacteria) TaxID=192944 RepID=UPI00109DCB52|nr:MULTISPECIES: hypothetical protein [unclassified Rhodococcus (in: high G+C Gram-positive bacteria)]QCB52115.1 hypothetical protein E5769_19880 [Rhodococcus sp. PAMC28705]QCB59717.1 hypothetical protein E5720_15640 [Rhodococcus sp. PAMC28707]
MPTWVVADTELDNTASELCAVDPRDFVTARTAAVAVAKESGDRKLAASIGKLRKPTTVAWMVNLLVREEPESIAELFDIGNSLRDAQRRSSAERLKELSVARAQSIRALTRRAVEIAREHGHPSTENAAREVGQTLGAALADPEIGARVQAGRVVTAESYSGFGPAVLTLAPEPENTAQESSPENPEAETRDDAADKRLEEARGQLTEAHKDEESAREAVDSADSASEAASTDLSEIKERVARLRAALHDAEVEEAAVRTTEKSADREARRLRRVLTDAEARTAELRSTVERLGG